MAEKYMACVLFRLPSPYFGLILCRIHSTWSHAFEFFYGFYVEFIQDWIIGIIDLGAFAFSHGFQVEIVQGWVIGILVLERHC